MSNLKIVFGSQFKRDLKKHFLVLASAEWAKVLYYLTKQQILPERYVNHSLTGKWTSFKVSCQTRHTVNLRHQQ